VPGWKNDIIGFNDYYFLHERFLCTCAFSTSAVASMVDDGAFPPGSTELDDETGHNCQMPRTLYHAFCALVLGLPSEFWTNTHSKAAFCNMLLQDLDAILHYYAVSYSVPTGNHGINEPILLPGNQADMAKILARLTILLIGADACTPHIINSVWGKNDNVCLALGRPRGDLSLIHRCLLSLSKIAINTIYIWTTDPELPVLDPKSRSFKYLPPTLQTILLHSCKKLTYACKPVPSGAASTKLLTDNLQAHTVPDNSTFEDKAIQWFCNLLLNNDELDDMIGVNNGILVAYRMCPPCEILVPCNELSLIRSSSNKPTYFMQCPSNDTWELADA
jgi:hypothetical protein